MADLQPDATSCPRVEPSCRRGCGVMVGVGAEVRGRGSVVEADLSCDSFSPFIVVRVLKHTELEKKKFVMKMVEILF